MIDSILYLARMIQEMGSNLLKITRTAPVPWNYRKALDKAIWRSKCIATDQNSSLQLLHTTSPFIQRGDLDHS